MAPANNYQVGGVHYQSKYQHWDLVLRCGLGYLEGCATKYMTRWRSKDGLKDLQKAQHFTTKLYEECYLGFPHARKPGRMVRMELNTYFAANQTPYDDQLIITILCTWETPRELETALAHLKHLISCQDIPEAKPVPAEDSNKYAERA